MFVFGHLVNAIAELLGVVLTLFYWLLLIRVLISWVNPDPYNQIVQILMKTTEPILAPIRQRMGMMNIGLDLSPIIAFCLILFLRVFLVATLKDVARRLLSSA